jgi:hypothetical protein
MRIEPLIPINVLCSRWRNRLREGRFGTKRTLSACGGYMRPSLFHCCGLGGTPENSSSTEFKVSLRSLNASFVDEAGGASCKRRRKILSLCCLESIPAAQITQKNAVQRKNKRKRQELFRHRRAGLCQTDQSTISPSFGVRESCREALLWSRRGVSGIPSFVPR